MAQDLAHTFQPMQGLYSGQHVSRIRTLPPTRFHQLGLTQPV
jgi:hypothetical protein